MRILFAILKRAFQPVSPINLILQTESDKTSEMIQIEISPFQMLTTEESQGRTLDNRAWRRRRL